MGSIRLANKRIYSFFVENPISGDNVPRILVPRQFIAQTIRAVKLDSASGSLDWTLRFDPDASQTGGGTILHSATGLANNTTGTTTSAPFTNGTVPADNWLWLELANVTTGIFRPVAVMIEVIGVERGA